MDGRADADGIRRGSEGSGKTQPGLSGDGVSLAWGEGAREENTQAWSLFPDAETAPSPPLLSSLDHSFLMGSFRRRACE